ncbi:F0F1 ATP synthase subunit C [Desulfovibrio mangrovi]|uniref:F0F1 ATP synthase subunit C n=1 Tax=Desulfovibrio mangrovi TaxID=2976983 RepID=UPI00224773F3|nr:F0F1 ATP synthase subunit C [Desulfovibrio mangrovi]UZP68804.1 F0F1 ATP synthase subunit C [Desulfovibrio mangrovi]
MDTMGWIAVGSVLAAGICMGLGAIGSAIGEGIALSRALSSIAQQPDETNTIIKFLFVGMAMVESTGIYCLVLSMILLFANPFWAYFLEKAGG